MFSVQISAKSPHIAPGRRLSLDFPCLFPPKNASYRQFILLRPSIWPLYGSSRSIASQTGVLLFPGLTFSGNYSGNKMKTRRLLRLHPLSPERTLPPTHDHFKDSDYLFPLRLAPDSRPPAGMNGKEPIAER